MDNPLPVNPVTPPPPEPINLSPMPEAQPNFPQPTPKPTSPTPPETDLLSPEEPKGNNNLILGFVIILLILALGTAGYFFYQNMQLKNQNTQVQPTPSSSPTSTPDSTSNWETYTNALHRITFKYPLTWQIDSTGDQRSYDAQVILTKGQAKITMFFSMDGIGGEGQNYEGQPFKLDGIPLYRFVKSDTVNNTRMVGISNSLTNTLGVFKINEKVYSIILNYPLSYAQTETGTLLENEFDLLLSTFKFLGASPSPEVSPTASPSASPSI